VGWLVRVFEASVRDAKGTIYRGALRACNGFGFRTGAAPATPDPRGREASGSPSRF